MRIRLFCLAAAGCLLACGGLSLPFAQPAVTIVVSAADPAAATPDALEAARSVIQARCDESLNGRANVIVSGADLHIELFDDGDTALASQLATEVGALEFFDSDISLSDGAPAPAGAAPIL